MPTEDSLVGSIERIHIFHNDSVRKMLWNTEQFNENWESVRRAVDFIEKDRELNLADTQCSERLSKMQTATWTLETKEREIELHKMAFIELYRDRFSNPNLKVPYLDAMIIYNTETDQDKAEEFCSCLNELKLPNEKYVTATLYNDSSFDILGGTVLRCADAAQQHCTFTFVLLTKGFCETYGDEPFIAETILLQCVREKKWNFIPINTCARQTADYTPPFGFDTIKSWTYTPDCKKRCMDLIKKRIEQDRTKYVKTEELLEKQFKEAKLLEEKDSRMRGDGPTVDN